MLETTIPAWQEKFGWFWFNYKEIYLSTDEELEQKVKEYADMGITTLIGFSSTHFRFNFMAYKDKIHECIRKIVKFCHKYKIRYVEHHSSVLYYVPKTKEGLDYFTNQMVQKGDRMEDWEGLVDTALGDPVVDGYRYSGMTQIEGSTGNFARTPYFAYALCRNNPNYREVYFKYLEELYELGIDGIMNDEVQWFGFTTFDKNEACTCPRCRALFKKMYGYELPEPEKWEEFYDNYSNPAFVAWKRFKLETNEQFVRDVNNHFKALGLNLMRPNYIAHILSGNPTAAPFERCADIWDFVFQENCTFSIISASFVEYAIEAIHRNAMGNDYNHPSMSMFYPYNESNLYFSFALAKSWGQLFMQTSEDQLGIDSLEKEYRLFEEKHFDFLDSPRRLADLAFLYSPITRDFTGKEANTNRFCAALQGAYMSNIGADLVFENASYKKMASYKIIVSAFNTMLSDETLRNLSEYTKKDGKLVIIGDFAKLDDFGKERTADEIYSFFDGWTTLCQNGNIIELEENAFFDKTQKNVITNRHKRGTERAASSEYVVDKMRETTGRVLESILGRKKVEYSAKEDLLTSAFDTDAGVAVHIVNITDVIKKNGEIIAHFDPIKPYCKDATPCGAVKVFLETERKIIGATAFTPEREEGVELTLSEVDGGICVTVPEGFFSGYCLIELRSN